MHLVHFILSFIAGALVCNAIPHLTAGLRGELFPSPFTSPRGVAPSPPEVNVLWGAANLFLGLFLFIRHPGWLGFALGFTIGGYFLAKNFGKVRAAGFQR